MPRPDPLSLWFEDIRGEDGAMVGSKAAALGEMYRELTPAGVRVPYGFATTVAAHRMFLQTQLPALVWSSEVAGDVWADILETVAPGGTLAQALGACFDGISGDHRPDLHDRCVLARHLIESTAIPGEVSNALRSGYARLCDVSGRDAVVAVRSSVARKGQEAASPAGHSQSFLNVRGEDGVLHYWKQCCAGLFTEQAVSDQLDRELDPCSAELAIVIMRMVRAGSAASGDMVTLDPISGHDGILRVRSTYGLGKGLAHGKASPDSFTLWKEGVRSGKPAIVRRRLGDKQQRMICARGGRQLTEVIEVPPSERRAYSLSNREVLELGRMALALESHYGRPLEIDWTKDGRTGEIFVVEVRAETRHSGKIVARAESRLGRRAKRRWFPFF